MKKLSDLYKGYPDIYINDIKINSKEVEKDDIFVCIKGATTDRHDYVKDAINNGAAAIVASKKIEADIPVIYVKDTNKEFYKLAASFYDNPQEKLELISVTGTNGKTTTSRIIQDLIGKDKCGYIGTNGIIYNNFSTTSRNTTPDADKLYKYFDKFVKNNCKYATMEVSSEALFYGRVQNLQFKAAIFTNITEDHLNTHKTIRNYVACKQRLFSQVKEDGFSILNTDDKYFESTYKKAKGTILTYGKKKATLQIKEIKEYLHKTTITFKYKNKLHTINSPLLGEFNAYNLCAAILALLALNYDLKEITKNIKNIEVPKGRVEFLDFGQDFKILLDYAHTTDAFEKLYKLLDSIKKKKRIITVTGSAGGREHEKRKDMGKLILDKSDYVIFTMDDPRNEDVNEIIDELVSDTKNINYERVINRKKAIFKAFDLAGKNDIVLIAGKGNDNYMAIGNKYLPYNDTKTIKEYFTWYNKLKRYLKRK